MWTMLSLRKLWAQPRFEPRTSFVSFIMTSVYANTVKSAEYDQEEKRAKNLGLNRDLNPGPPAPEAGIIPLDH